MKLVPPIVIAELTFNPDKPGRPWTKTPRAYVKRLWRRFDKASLGMVLYVIDEVNGEPLKAHTPAINEGLS